MIPAGIKLRPQPIIAFDAPWSTKLSGAIQVLYHERFVIRFIKKFSVLAKLHLPPSTLELLTLFENVTKCPYVIRQFLNKLVLMVLQKSSISDKL